MKQHFKHERTLVIIKPDGIQRSLIGEVIGRYERVGLKLVALKMMHATPKLIEEHYTLDPSWLRIVGEKALKNYEEKGLKPPSLDASKISKRILNGLIRYITSGPIIAMVWEGAHAVAIVRKITGGTEPLASDVGTIRGDFVLDSYQMSDVDGRSIRNVVHASTSVKEAKDEIKHWFKASELMNYTIVQEKILYDADLEGISK